MIGSVVRRTVHGGLFSGAIVLDHETFQGVDHIMDLTPLYGSRFVEDFMQRANTVLLSLGHHITRS